MSNYHKMIASIRQLIVNTPLVLAGFDCRLLTVLDRKKYRQIYFLSVTCIAVAFMVGCGLGYGALTTGVQSEVALLMIFFGGVFCINLFRMLNAGGSFPVRFVKDNVNRWSPSKSSGVVLTIFGALLTLPCAMYIYNSFQNDPVAAHQGIIVHWQNMFSEPMIAIGLIVFCSLLFSSFYWLRFVFISAVRQYEEIKWDNDRRLIDKAFQNLNTITANLFYRKERRFDEFKHFSDAPYNLRPKLFGTEISLVEENKVKFIDPDVGIHKDSESLINTGDEGNDGVNDNGNNNSIDMASETYHFTRVQTTTYPEFFEKTVQESICSLQSSTKAKVAKYLKIDLKTVEQRLLQSSRESQLADIFAFELMNYALFEKYSESDLSYKQALSAQQEALQKYNPQDIIPPSCPICKENLTHSITSQGLLYHCKQCVMTLFTEEQMLEFYNLEFDRDLKDKPYTLYQGPQKLCCLRDNSHFERYTLIAPSPDGASLYAANVSNITNSRINNSNNQIHRLQKPDVTLDICPSSSCYYLSDDQSHHINQIIQEHLSREQLAEREPIGFRYVLQLLTGLPKEVYNPLKKLPKILGLTVAMILTMYLWQQIAPEYTQQNFLLYPNQFLENPLVLLSSIFMHANHTHLLGNVLFLWIFSDNIEDKYGWKIFVLLFLFTGICGNLLHIFANFNSNIGLLGASGAVYGMMGAYMVFYQKMKVWWVILFIRLKVSIIFFVLFRVAMDVYGYFFSQDNIAWLAHIGGFIGGVFIALLIKNRIFEKLRIRMLYT